MNGSRIAFISVAFVAASVLASAGSAAAADKEFKAYKASQIQWADAPSIGPGAKIAVLEGDLKSAGPLMFRLKVPPNTKVPVHTHPGDERVTMIAGTLYFATGDKFDAKKATVYKAGDTFIVPQGTPMYAFTKSREAVAQIHGTGPWGITYLDDVKAQGATR